MHVLALRMVVVVGDSMGEGRRDGAGDVWGGVKDDDDEG